jgi:hypothetical protein
MRIIGLEPTNRCNRSCRHCFRKKADPPGSLPLETAAAILSQAGALGFNAVCLTGGEVSLYPHLGDLLHLIAAQGFDFNLVTKRLPLPGVCPAPGPGARGQGASGLGELQPGRGPGETHDGLRGPKSFREVIEGATLCRNHHASGVPSPGRRRPSPPGRYSCPRGP